MKAPHKKENLQSTTNSGKDKANTNKGVSMLPVQLHYDFENNADFFPLNKNTQPKSESNKGVKSFSKPPLIQAKFAVGLPGDKYEEEADTTADHVVPGLSETNTTTPSSSIQDLDEPAEEEKIKPKIQRKTGFAGNGGPEDNSGNSNNNQNISQITSGSGLTIAPKGIEQQIHSSKGGGNELDSGLKPKLEEKMNADFSNVRVHDNKSAHQMNRRLGSKAFTHKNDIFFNQGQYQPTSFEGRHLLVHELTHTIQQAGVQGASQIQRAPVATVVTALNAAISASDKPAYMDALRIENATHAEDLTIYSTIQGHLAGSSLTLNEAWQAVCILNFGNDTDRPHPWPVTIQNFFEGIILGEFTVTGIAPRLKDEIHQLAVSIAHTAITSSIGGNSMGPFMVYMGKFNALWETSAFAALTSTFDNTLSNKGPKTQRSRTIFNHLYTTDAQVTSDYDNNVVGMDTGTERMRKLVDQYVGPESRNLIASPRLQQLREQFFAQSTITSSSVANATYVAFKNTIRPFAEALNQTDREELENSHQWRLIIDWTVRHPTLREDLAQFLQTAFLSAAAPANTNAIIGVGTNISGTAAVSSSGPRVATVPPPALTADQQTFVDNMTLHATNLSITSEDEETTMELFGRSSRDEAGLAFRTRIVINNPANHRGGTGNTFETWPSASVTGVIHRPRVGTGTGRGTTTYTATLTLEHPDGTPIARTGGAAIPTISIAVIDNRYNAFSTNMTDHLFGHFVGGKSQFFTPGDTVRYYGGQGPLDIKPFLNRDPISGNHFTLPPGLVVFSEAEVTKNGTPLTPPSPLGPTRFREGASTSFLGRVISTGPDAPPAPDAMVVTVRFKEGSATGPVFHTRTEAFDFEESVASAAGTTMANQLTALSAQLAADHTALNTATPTPPIPASGAGTIIDEMIHHGTPQSARIAQTILAGTITLQPMIIRPDSEAFMATQIANGHARFGATSGSHVIFALGNHPLDTAPMINPPNTVEESPSVNAIQWPEPRFTTTIHIHLTTSLTPLVQRTNFSSMIKTIVHEAVHMVDIRPNSGTFIERYRTEFRAYWMDGGRDHLSTAFDPGMDNLGPKSEKARAIFNHLYFSNTYAFVKTNYDANTNGFRDQVNSYLTPDGINLIVSQKLEDIRAAIAGFGSTYGPAQRTTINDLYNGNAAAGIAATTADDKREITGNRAWRELVESKGFSATHLTDIKNDLHIPL